MSGNLYGKGVSAVPYLNITDSSIGNTSISNMANTAIIPRAVYVAGVSLNKSTLALAPEETETLFVTIDPIGADTQTVAWASDTEAVATVEDGVVTAVADGTATITVTTTDGGFTAECEVTVATA